MYVGVILIVAMDGMPNESIPHVCGGDPSIIMDHQFNTVI